MFLLSLITFLPLVGALLLFAVPEKKAAAVKRVAMLTAGITFQASLALIFKFDGESYGFQLVETWNWIPQLGISYRLGIDGISLWLVLLTTLLSVVAVGCSLKIDNRLRSFLACILVLETAMVGTFVSLDLVLFFVFFETTLIPMWILVNIWGGAKRAHAANKFLIYTFAGSIFMLVGIIGLAYLNFKSTGTLTFDLVAIQSQVASGQLWAGALQAEPFVFWAFAIAFLVKSPSFPFHTWIPDTYAESPIAGVILSSVMVKMGTYGFLRFCITLFPDVLRNQIPILITFAVIGIVYGAAIAAVQADVRRVMAYSTLSHMGFVLLGIFSLTRIGVMGGALQQLNHGISTGLLFLLIGYFYQRRGSTLMSDMGGLKSQMPIFAALFLIAMLSSVGLPGLNGFVGEFLVLLGAFQSAYLSQFSIGLVVVAVFGVVLSAVYLLYMFQRMFYGQVSDENRSLPDIKGPEIALAGVLIVFVFWGGLAPNTFIRPMQASVDASLLMSQNPAGKRPVWGASDTPIDYFILQAPKLTGVEPPRPIVRHRPVPMNLRPKPSVGRPQ